MILTVSVQSSAAFVIHVALLNTSLALPWQSPEDLTELRMNQEGQGG